MTREEEIEILIIHLEKDTIRISNEYPRLLSDAIVKNGKLIENYTEELKNLNNND